MMLDETCCMITERLRLTEDIKINDIPDMDLYMEQLLTFLNSRLAPCKREPKDKVLTKTMINNYTKDQLLPPPKNKKYDKDHIMLLILVYQLKNVLSIRDIKQLFGPILKDMSIPDDDVIPLADIYSTFLAIKKEQFAEFGDHFAEKHAFIRTKTASVAGDGNRNMADLFLTVLMLVAQANVSKRLAENIIDAYFADPAEEGEG